MARSRWSAASTWTTNPFPASKASNDEESRPRHQSSSGGWSDTVVKLLAVIPAGSPSASSVVMAVTPVAKRPAASRKSLASNVAAMRPSRRPRPV